MGLGTIAILLAGIVALVGGAEALVRGAARLAARTGMSSVVIGLTIVAFGTSAPELAVSVGDALRGGDDAGAIAIGNVVGSNIANVLLVLGLAAAVGGSLFVAQRIVRLDVPLMIGASVLVLIFVLDERLSRVEGVILLIALAVYVTWTVVAATKGSTPDIVTQYDEALDELDGDNLNPAPVYADIGFLVLGLALLVFGSQALVSSASNIATELGVSDLVIGLTVVAIGTSLPEVATSVLAAIRGQLDIAVGNAIGSNLFNLLAVLGTSAVVSPKAIPVAASAVQVDIPVMLAVAVACLPIFANGHVLSRWEGIAFLFGYAGYLIWLVLDATDQGARDTYGDVAVFFVVPAVALTIATLWYRGRADDPAELR